MSAIYAFPFCSLVIAARRSPLLPAAMWKSRALGQSHGASPGSRPVSSIRRRHCPSLAQSASCRATCVRLAPDLTAVNDFDQSAVRGGEKSGAWSAHLAFRPHRSPSTRTAPEATNRKRMRVKAMLGFEHARRKAVRSVAGEHRHGGLRHDRTLIHLVPDEMHGAAALLSLRPQARELGIEPLEGGQQRGMDVDDGGRANARRSLPCAAA